MLYGKGLFGGNTSHTSLLHLHLLPPPNPVQSRDTCVAGKLQLPLVGTSSTCRTVQDVADGLSSQPHSVYLRTLNWFDSIWWNPSRLATVKPPLHQFLGRALQYVYSKFRWSLRKFVVVLHPSNGIDFWQCPLMGLYSVSPLGKQATSTMV